MKRTAQYIAVSLFGILCLSTMISIVIEFSKLDPPAPKDKISFVYQDYLINPAVTAGFMIQEWPCASLDEPMSVWEVKILIEGVGYTRGPVFDTRDKAERVMIWRHPSVPPSSSPQRASKLMTVMIFP